MIGISRGLTMALGAAALIAGACQKQDDASRRQARSATQGAEQASDRAAKAEKKAADERGDVAGAQKDVAEKQQELAKAQQKENKEMGEARGAEQQATQASRDAQQQSATAQQTTAEQGRQQAEAQKQQAAGSAAAAAQPDTEKIASGQVVSAKQDELVLRQGSGAPDLKLKVSPSTTVMMGGREASVSELTEGTQVRASYHQAGGDQQAIRIEALTGPAGSGPSNIGAPPAEKAPGTTSGATGTERR